MIINRSLREGNVPTTFKHAHVCPLFKSGNPSDSRNYRPISLLPVASKLLEKVVLRQVVEYLESECPTALPPEQFAYRRQHSCEDTLALSIDTWRKALDENQVCGVVFADLSKAFDNVRHTQVIQELADLGFEGTALKWFCNYLSERTQCVVIGHATGRTSHCTKGVPQGSVLGPLLFCLYIRRLPDIFAHSVVRIYADDIAFYFIAKTVSGAMVKLQEDLDNLDSYINAKCLTLNPGKTQLLVIHRANAEVDLANVELSCRGTAIRPTDTVKYLGVLIDQHLTFSQQVNKVCRSALGKVATFRHGRRNLSSTACRIFYLSVVQSTLDYASTSYVHSLSTTLFDKLCTTSQICLRKVFGLHRFTSASFILEKHNLYSLSQRMNLKLYVFVYRILNRRTSDLLRPIFTTRCAGPHTHAHTRGQSSSSLVLPRVFSRYGYHSLSFLAADRWNLLPSTCREDCPLPEFVRRTKNFLGFPVKRLRPVGLP